MNAAQIGAQWNPHNRLGRWSVGLLVNSFVFMPTSSDAPWCHVILPFHGIAMLLCGFGAGIVGLLAIVCQCERAWSVWLAVLPMLRVIFMLVGEFLFPH